MPIEVEHCPGPNCGKQIMWVEIAGKRGVTAVDVKPYRVVVWDEEGCEFTESCEVRIPHRFTCQDPDLFKASLTRWRK